MRRYFDDFVFQSRVMPVLVILMPIFVFAIFKEIIDNNFLEYSIHTTIISIFLTLSSGIAGENGKKYEDKMYTELEGMPTTIILRYSDDTIDNLTKTRYHKKLNERVMDVNLPISANEEDANTDICYKSAINWLRVYANSNRDVEYRVYQELKEYNFWRNLYGTRIIAFITYFTISLREIFLIEEFNIRSMIVNPYPQYVTLGIMILSINLLAIFVNKKTVQKKAFKYAKALVEVCERL